MNDHLNLFVPEWQGYGVDQSPGQGANELKETLFSDVSFQEIAIDPDPQISSQHKIVAYSANQQILKDICGELAQHQPKTLFTLGGTCSVEIGPVTYLNAQNNGDLAVIWFDAHGDLNTPSSSPSGHFHGMPVRTILGEGESEMCNLAFSILTPSQIFLVGARDLDPPESEFIDENSIAVLPPNPEPGELANTIRKAGFSNVYIHFDLDVLDPNEFTDMIFHVPDGMGCDTALQLINELRSEFNVAGSSLLEFVMRGNSQSEFLGKLRKLLLQ